MFKTYLNKCILGETLTVEEAELAMDIIMAGNATASQIASMVSIMRFRGETVDEMIGFTKSMRKNMRAIKVDDDNVIDTCGTGGDGAATFNISTTVSLILPVLGVKVAKHGNRAVSSKSGSADVIEALGLPIQTTIEEAEQAIANKGMSFLFAPLFHEAMKYAAAPRKEIGFRTIFNILGPLSNPARAKRQVLGIYDTTFAENMAETLHSLGSKHVLFVTGKDGLDECTITTETDVVELKNGNITRYTIAPEMFGLKRGKIEDIQVETAEESAAIIKSIFQNKANEAATNIVLLNAGAALYVAGKAESIKEGIDAVKQALETGEVYDYYLSLTTKKEQSSYA